FKHKPGRTVTEADNVLFTTLTMNSQSLHLDAEVAAKSEFGQRLVNSLMTLAIAAGLSVGDTTEGTTIANLGFGEIIRVFLNNLEHPVNITNGPRGLDRIDPMSLWGLSLSKPLMLGDFKIASVTLYYWLFLALVVLSVLLCYRLEHSRIGRAWMAIREDELAARAMGINTRDMKLLAFALGASFGGVAGAMFAAFQGFVSPESFSLMESIMVVAMVVLGGIGHLPGVILGALLLAALPEVLRYIAGDIQNLTGGRIDAAILRQLLIALAMIGIMLLRPQGLWPGGLAQPGLARRT
ncbi:MAG: hypothetical protein EBW39_03335, partial [Betaproteobacteria bacterium]|nr:hypothetical protein [Betaproteobacteria bacterium]